MFERAISHPPGQFCRRRRPADLLCRAGDVPVGCEGEGAPANGLTARETIPKIAAGASWMAMRFVDQGQQCLAKDAAARGLRARLLAWRSGSAHARSLARQAIGRARRLMGIEA